MLEGSNSRVCRESVEQEDLEESPELWEESQQVVEVLRWKAVPKLPSLEELTRRFWHLCGNTWVGGRFQGLHLRRF